jgi:putative aldouronate transport system permease protein
MKLIKLKQFWPLYVMFAPVAAFYIIFHYKPLYGIIIAFKDYNFVDGIWNSAWTSNYGFKHFIRFVGNGEFWRIFKNTIVLAALRIAVTFPAPVILALMFNEIKNQKYKKLLQTFSYLPHFVSFVIVYAIFYSVFTMDGFINNVRNVLGLDKILFLGSVRYYRGIFVGMALWKEIGWGAISTYLK